MRMVCSRLKLINYNLSSKTTENACLSMARQAEPRHPRPSTAINQDPAMDRSTRKTIFNSISPNLARFQAVKFFQTALRTAAPVTASVVASRRQSPIISLLERMFHMARLPSSPNSTVLTAVGTASALRVCKAMVHKLAALLT